MNKKIIYILLIVAGLSQCKVNKNTGAKNAVKNIITKEIKVEANRQKNSAEQPYQPSAKRINDILHTVLDIRFDYEKQQVIGKAVITIKPYFYPVASLDLDAKSFELKRVAMISKDTHDLKYTYDSSVIHINLGREYLSSETYVIYIDYIATPKNNKQKGSAAINDAKGLYFINPLRKDTEKPRQIWSQGETQSNSGWFPTNDVPNEKMTHEIAITVDEKDVTLSNGELTYSRVNNNKTRTDYWKQSLPNAPYLVMIAVGEFEIVKDSWRDSIEVNYYVEPAYKPYAKLIFGNTPEMLEFFSKKLGVDYPWDKFSQIVVRDFVSGAMENTSAVVHFEGLNHDAREHLDNTYESIISHELFHHWFGDLVTCESWSNVPLNESFATYGSYLWDEYKYGRMEADHNFDENLRAYIGQKFKHKSNLIRFNYKNREDLFDVISYQKGSRVLHMLRNYVGDDAFFKSLQLYLTKNKFKTVEVHDLRLAFEEITGEDLNWFFNQWFLKSGHPALNIAYKYDVEHKNVEVIVEQKQDSAYGIFKLPLAIDIYSNGKVKRNKILIENKTQSFSFSSAAPIDLVNFDADKMLLASITDMKPMEEYYFMFEHAPLFMDKQLAATGIISNMTDSADKELKECIAYALHHEFYGVREMGIEMADKLNDNEKAHYEDAIIKIMHHDKKSSVRADALETLSEYDAAKFKNEFIKATNDSSYNVVTAALKAIASTDPELALRSAEQFKTAKSGSIQLIYANLVAGYAKGDYVAYFEGAIKKYEKLKYNFMMSYNDYLKRQDSTMVLRALPGLKSYYMGLTDGDLYLRMMIKFIENNLAMQYENIITDTEEKKKKLKSTDPKINELNVTIAAANSMLKKIREITALPE